MSIFLRLILVVASFIACGYAVRKIQKAQMNIEAAMYWFFLSFFLLVLSIFPELAMWSAKMIGIESPVNLVFLVIIFLVLLKLFSTSVKLSQLENKINMLTEELAVRNYISENRSNETKDHEHINQKDDLDKVTDVEQTMQRTRGDTENE